MKVQGSKSLSQSGIALFHPDANPAFLSKRGIGVVETWSSVAVNAFKVAKGLAIVAL